jgi:phospholipase A1
MNFFLKILALLLAIFYSYNCSANNLISPSPTLQKENPALAPTVEQANTKSTIQKRADGEATIMYNRFAIGFYKPTYILPYYYTASPDNQVYQGATPSDQSIKSSEAKFQFSLKVPVFVNLINDKNTLYLAYTQLSYWQLYSKSAFFRETDFEPEIFLSHKLKFFLGKDWYFDFVNVGAVHQSNGFGGNMERTWNRIYLEAVLSNNNWMVRLKPWYVIHDNSYKTYNPNLAQYLGYGQVVVAYQYNRHVLSFLGHSFFLKNGKRATVELSYSFPLTVHLNGYVQFFSGYGQSLIEYNHRTNSAGIGIALSNWV